MLILNGCVQGGALPLFITTPSKDARVGSEYSYQVKAIAPKTGKQATIKAITIPEWLRLKAEDNITKLIGEPQKAGNYLVTLVAKDGGSENHQSFEIIVKENSQPELLLRDESIQAGTDYRRDVKVYDADGDKITVEVINIPQGLICTPKDNCSVVAGNIASQGEYTLRFSLSDGFAVTEASFKLKVKNENATPEIITVPEEKVVAGGEYRYVVQAIDNNLDNILTLKALKNPSWLEFEDLGKGVGVLKGTAGEGDIGKHEIMLQVEDNHDPKASQTQEFMLEVTKPNSPPIFESLPNTNAREENAYEYQIQVKDDDKDPIQICPDDDSVSNCVFPTWLNLEDKGNGIGILKSAGEVTKEQRGSHFVVLVATDGKVETKQSFTLVVSDSNFAPSFIELPLADAPEDKLYVGTIKVSDNDGPKSPVKITVTINPPQGKSSEWLKFTDHQDNTAILEGIPTEEHRGSYQIILKADDGKAATEQTVTIVVGDVNKAPEFTQLPLADAPEDKVYKATIIATDEDGPAELKITAEIIPPTGKDNWLTFTDQGDGVATLEGTPTEEHRGSYQIILKANDGKVITEQTITIVVGDVNKAPEFTQLPLADAPEDKTYKATITATDEDGPAELKMTSEIIPPTGKGNWLTFTDQGKGVAILEGMPTVDNRGTYQVALRAFDGKATTEQVVAIVVSDVNQAPSFVDSPNINATEDSLYSQDIRVQDPDGFPEELSVNVAQTPDWLTGWFDLTNNIIRLEGTPKNDDVGQHGVVLKLSDGKAEKELSFTLFVANTNDPPYFDFEEAVRTGGLVGTYIDNSVRYMFPHKANLNVSEYFKDPDIAHGDRLVFRATQTDGSSLPSWLQLDEIGGNFFWNGNNIEGITKFEVFITATDSSNNSSKVRITIENPEIQFSISGDDFATDIATDDFETYIVGYTRDKEKSFDSDAFIRKYDSEGNILWTDRFGHLGDDRANSIAIYTGHGFCHPDDQVISSYGIYVVGDTQSDLEGSNSSGNAFIRKYDRDGTVVWTKQFGSITTPSATATAIAVDDFYGCIYVVGSAFNVANDSLDAFIHKYDGDGNLLWTDQFGGNEYYYDYDGANGIDLDLWGNIYVVGSTTNLTPTDHGGVDAFIRKYNGGGYDSDHNVNWTKQFGTSGYDSATGVAIDYYDHDGKVYVVGITNGPNLDGAFIQRYNSKGKVVWTDQFDTVDYTFTLDIMVNDDTIYLVGAGCSKDDNSDLLANVPFIRQYNHRGNLVWNYCSSYDLDYSGIAIGEINHHTGIYVVGKSDSHSPYIVIHKYYHLDPYNQPPYNNNIHYEGRNCDTTTNQPTEANPDGIFIYTGAKSECILWKNWRE